MRLGNHRSWVVTDCSISLICNLYICFEKANFALVGNVNRILPIMISELKITTKVLSIKLWLWPLVKKIMLWALVDLHYLQYYLQEKVMSFRYFRLLLTVLLLYVPTDKYIMYYILVLTVVVHPRCSWFVPYFYLPGVFT